MNGPARTWALAIPLAGMVLSMSGCNQLAARDQLNKGVEAYKSARYEEAIGHFRRALAIDTSDPGIYSSLGGALVALGRSTEASEAFEKAAALAPRKAGFFWNLASVRRFSGEQRHGAPPAIESPLDEAFNSVRRRQCNVIGQVVAVELALDISRSKRPSAAR